MDPQTVEPPAQDPAAPRHTVPPSGAPDTLPLHVVGKTVHDHIHLLQDHYRQDRPYAVAVIARIRRGAGKPAGALPDLWGLTGTESLDVTGWKEDALARAENAVHIAVTLWALHQQSHRDAAMHVRGPQLGAAVRRLMPEGEIDEPTRKHFVRAGTATSADILAQRLRNIVLLLRRGAIPLDYGVLADQLHRWQDPRKTGEVTRAWGRSFHTYRPRDTTGRADGADGPLAPPGDINLPVPSL